MKHIKYYVARLRTLLLMLVMASAAHAAVVTSVSPSSDITTGGATVVITGSGFTGTTGAANVKFSGVNAASYVVDSDTRITAVVATGGTVGKGLVFANGNNSASSIFTYKAANQATLVINITANIQQIISIVWTDKTTTTTDNAQAEGSTTALTWAIGNTSLNQIKTTNTNSVIGATAGHDFEVRNTGNYAETISAIATTGAAASTRTWAIAGTAAADTCYVAMDLYNTAANNNSGTITWNSLHQVVNMGTLAINGTQFIELKYQSPTSITWANDFGVLHTIAVTITAVSGP